MNTRRIGVVGAGNMGSGIAQKTAAEGFDVVLVDVDRAAVEAALEASRGNVTRATRLLGLRNRYVLYRVMRKLGIPSRES